MNSETLVIFFIESNLSAQIPISGAARALRDSFTRQTLKRFISSRLINGRQRVCGVCFGVSKRTWVTEADVSLTTTPPHHGDNCVPKCCQISCRIPYELRTDLVKLHRNTELLPFLRPFVHHKRCPKWGSIHFSAIGNISRRLALREHQALLLFGVWHVVA